MRANPPSSRGNQGNKHVEGTAEATTHLKACRGITLNLLQEHMEKFFAIWVKKLVEFAEKAGSDKQRQSLMESNRMVAHHRDDLLKSFLSYSSECFVQFRDGELETSTGEEKLRSDMLSLVDNEDLEETIAVSSVSNRAEGEYGEILWFLNRRMAALNGLEVIESKCNPVGPIQFGESLRKCLKNVEIPLKGKILAYKIFDKFFTPKLSEIYEEVNQYLLDQGILSNLSYAAASGGGVAGSGGDPLDVAKALNETLADKQGDEGAVPAPDASQAPEQYQGALLGAIRQLQGRLDGDPNQVVPIRQEGAPAPAGSPQASQQVQPQAPQQMPQQQGAPQQAASQQAPQQAGGDQGGVQGADGQPLRSVQVFSSNDLVTALGGLQNQGLTEAALSQPLSSDSATEMVPQNISLNSAQFIQQLREQVGEEEDKGLTRDHMHTIDLVGLLFEFMLNDENLPNVVKAMLSYLHTPFLKIAFSDPDFFEKTDHPARVLLNSMAEAGSKWVSNDGSSEYGVFEKIQEYVRHILENFEDDVKIFAKILLEFSTFTKKISRRVELLEKRAAEKVQGEEKLKEVKARVNREIRERTAGRQVPSAVLLLLLQPWSDYLAFVLLRYGEKSDSWSRALALVDDLLWSIEPKDNQPDKVRLMEMRDNLLGAVEAGLESIGYEKNKGKKLLDSVDSIHKSVLQDEETEVAPPPVRTKLESMADERAGLEDATEDEETWTDDEHRIVDNLKMIEFGTWFEFEGGRRLKVAWYNSKTSHYMLVDQSGKKVGMKSGIELARGMLDGNCKIIMGSTKPFFERALENIFTNLNKQAGTAEKATE